MGRGRQLLLVANHPRLLINFWFQGQGNLPTCCTVLGVSKKVWRPPGGLGVVVTLEMKGRRLLVVASSEK